MKATAQAPANIAFIKYWGKKNEKLRLPLNDSISMNLCNCQTTTTVEFSAGYKKDTFMLINNDDIYHQNAHVHNLVTEKNEAERVSKHLDRIRKTAKIKFYAKVASRNNFPRSAGIASSASGFAALTIAACSAAGIQMPDNFLQSNAIASTIKKISEKDLTILARLGSGSACRSIPDGFVIWEEGQTSKDSYAYSLYPKDYWDIRDLVLITESEKKKVTTSKGMENVWSSPLIKKRLREIPIRLQKTRQALMEKNIILLGETIEEEALDMHGVMQSQKPPLYYWNKTSEDIMSKVNKWRKEGIHVYFTIDAGPNVHLIFEGKDERIILYKIKSYYNNLTFIINKPAGGTRLVSNHLF